MNCAPPSGRFLYPELWLEGQIKGCDSGRSGRCLTPPPRPVCFVCRRIALTITAILQHPRECFGSSAAEHAARRGVHMTPIFSGNQWNNLLLSKITNLSFYRKRNDLWIKLENGSLLMFCTPLCHSECPVNMGYLINSDEMYLPSSVTLLLFLMMHLGGNRIRIILRLPPKNDASNLWLIKKTMSVDCLVQLPCPGWRKASPRHHTATTVFHREHQVLRVLFF